MNQRPQFGMRRPGFTRGPQLQILFEDSPLTAHSGESVAVALLAGGVGILSRSIKFHRPRSAFCLTGDCGSCLMRIDGQPNQRACRTPVHEGLRCERQNAWPSASLDILAAADEMFPEGMDHHSLMTSPRPLNQAMQLVVQQLGGLGRLPDVAPPLESLPRSQARCVALLVVGAGPAGLAAATEAARALGRAHKVLLVDAAPEAGGSYLGDPRFGPPAAAQAVAQAAEAGVEILTSAAAIAYYPEESALDDGRLGLVAISTPAGMLKITADCHLYATGGHEQNMLFADNDRPGVLAGRAVGRLHTQYGLSVGRRPLVVGDGDYAQALVAALRETGAQVLHVDGRSERVQRALGRSWVSGAILATPEGFERRVDCDAIAVVQPPAPAFELPHMHGAPLSLHADGGFAVVCEPSGRTSVPGVWVCGEITGILGVQASRAHGQAVGAAVASALSEGAPCRERS